MSFQPILCVDFDGVIHAYTSKWTGPRNISDGPVPGAIDWLMSLMDVPGALGAMAPPGKFRVMIYSSRSKHWGGRRAMK